MKRERYPDDWENMALRVKDGAGWACEECKRPCRKPGETGDQFAFRVIDHSKTFLEPWMVGPFIASLMDVVGNKLQMFTLTTAHLDHDPENPNPRLKALCSGCHLRYDAERRRNPKC